MVDPIFKYKVAAFAGAAFILVICGFQPAESAIAMEDCERCNYWQAKVDPSMTLSSCAADLRKEYDVGLTHTFEISEKEAADVLEAAECLLKLKGKTSPSTYDSGNVGYHLSTRFPGPTVEVAALYYVSALYHKNWRHGQAMVLTDKAGKKNTKKSIKTAYKAYQAWFEKVKEIGVEKARQQNLDPLAGTDVRWY